MKLGVVFPQTEIGDDPIALKDYAQAVEGMGYQYLLTYEHIVGANPERPGGWHGPYTHESAFHEPFVLFGYLAALTQKLTFVTGVVILPQRSATLVAKQAAQVDVLSGGRLHLGVGVGWNPVECQASGFEFHNRGQRIEEQIAVMRELWTKRLVTFKGQYHTLDDVGIKPMPVQQPIPIWMGGMADVVLRRAARLADGYLPNATSPEQCKPLLDTIRQYVVDEGRNPDNFGINARINLNRVEDRQLAADIQGWRDLNVSHLAVNTMGMGFTTLQQHLDAIQRFKEVAG
jgi:probable F420-dependent oxidoreductase